METDRPGGEIGKDYREVVTHLIDSQGWAYLLPIGGGYPKLPPADRSKPPIRVPMTGHTKGRRFRNWVAEIRRAGGHWPPGRQ